MENRLVCQACMVYPILWVLPFLRMFCRKQIMGLSDHFGHAKDNLPEKLKIDRFESSRSNKAGALHGGSVKIWILGVAGVSIPFVG